MGTIADRKVGTNSIKIDMESLCKSCRYYKAPAIPGKLITIKFRNGIPFSMSPQGFCLAGNNHLHIDIAEEEPYPSVEECEGFRDKNISLDSTEKLRA